MRVLLVENDIGTVSGISRLLQAAGAVVDKTDTGTEAFDLARHYDYDIVVLDLMPDLEAHSVVRRMRAVHLETPVLMMLSGLSGTEGKVTAFGIGVDDCLTKPFDKAELVARVHAVVRRNRGFSQSTLRAGPLELNFDTRQVVVHGKEVRLTGKEYSVLELLLLRKGQPLTKEAFLSHLYGGVDEPEQKIVDVFVCKLRKKLAGAGAGNLIVTVWGRGYTLREPAVIAAPQPVAAHDVSALVDAGD